MGDLGFWFVGLGFEPFDEIGGVESVAAHQAAGASLEGGGCKGQLLESGGCGDDGEALEGSVRRRLKSQKGFQAFADGIRVGQAVLMRQHVPSGVEEGWGVGRGGVLGESAQPGREILVEGLLRSERVRDCDDNAILEGVVEGCSQEGSGGLVDSVEVHSSAPLQAPEQGLRGWRLGEGDRGRVNSGRGSWWPQSSRKVPRVKRLRKWRIWGAGCRVEGWWGVCGRGSGVVWGRGRFGGRNRRFCALTSAGQKISVPVLLQVELVPGEPGGEKWGETNRERK